MSRPGSSRRGDRPHALRNAVLSAVIPPPSPMLPAAGEVELDAFWVRFDETAPLHLRLGFGAATVALGTVLPRLFGHGASLIDLDADAREAVIARGATLAGFVDLLEIAKVVACMAYFSDAAVQTHFRRAP